MTIKKWLTLIYMIVVLVVLAVTFKTFAATSTTYDVMNMSMIDKKMVNFDGHKTVANIPANSTENIDLTVTDDSLFTGANLYAPSSCSDDEVKFQVLMGSTVVMQFIDWFVTGGINKEQNYPAKIPSGFVLRAVYKNTCSTSVNVKINYSFHKVLQ